MKTPSEPEITSIPPRARMPHGARTIELKKVYFRYGRQLPDILGGLDISVCAGEAFFSDGRQRRGQKHRAEHRLRAAESVQGRRIYKRQA